MRSVLQFCAMTFLLVRYKTCSCRIARGIAVVLLLLTGTCPMPAASDANRLDITTRTGTHTFTVELALDNRATRKGPYVPQADGR